MANFGDQYFTIPAGDSDGPDPEPVEVSLAFSLVGARRGEVVPCDKAEVVTPKGQQELRAAGSIFRRIKVTHTWQTAYTTEREQIDCWQRV